MRSRREETRQCAGKVILAVKASAIAAGIALLLLMLTTIGRGMTAGRTREIPPGDRNAQYLLFPQDPAADGIRRAVIVDGTELSGTVDFRYYDGDVEKTVSRERMSLYPPASPEVRKNCIAELNREIERWAKETDIRRIDFAIDGSCAILTKHLKNGKIERCTYEIRAAHTPAAVTIRHGL